MSWSATLLCSETVGTIFIRTPLALTAYVWIEDRADAIAAGYQQHAAKPIQPGRGGRREWRDGRAATIITSNRAVDEWVALFDDPILANSALDRFAHRAHQIIMEGPSLRAARAPAGKPGRRPAKEAQAG